MVIQHVLMFYFKIKKRWSKIFWDWSSSTAKKRENQICRVMSVYFIDAIWLQVRHATLWISDWHFKNFYLAFGSLLFFQNHPPLCSPATESIAEPPLSEPTLPPCSAGEVRSVEPSVAAVLPSSSDAGAEIIAIAVTVNTPRSSGQDTWS